MNKLMTIAATCVFGFMASAAQAGDMDAGDDMMKDDMKSSMEHDGMKKDDMGHGMEDDGMAKDTMGMEDDSMAMDDEMKDDMKDDNMKNSGSKN